MTIAITDADDSHAVRKERQRRRLSTNLSLSLTRPLLYFRCLYNSLRVYTHVLRVPVRLNRGQRRRINREVGRARENEREGQTDRQPGGRKRRNEHAFVGQQTSRNETSCPRNSTRMYVHRPFLLQYCVLRSDTIRGSRVYFSKQT